MEPYGVLLGEPVHEVKEDKADNVRIEQVDKEVDKEFKKKPYRRYRNKPRKRPDGTPAPPSSGPEI